MGSVHSYTTRANLSRLSDASSGSKANPYTSRVNVSRLSTASADSKPSPYTSRVNLSRLSGVNAEAFVRNASLLSRLGGEAVLSSMVRFFYGKALHNPLTNKLFDAPDAATLENQIRQQIAFLKVALGGAGDADVPATYAYLSTIGISHAQFDAVVESIMATLRGQNVPPTVITEVEAFCNDVRGSILRNVAGQ